MKTIDLTPTWEQILPALLLVVVSGDIEGKQIGREELLRMAKVADKYVAIEKAKGNVHTRQKGKGK